MPVGWFSIPLSQSQATANPWQNSVVAPNQLGPNGLTYQGSDLNWSSDRASFDPIKNISHLDGHVRVTFGEDVLTADQVEAHFSPTEQFLIARSNTHIVDPVGSIRAQNLKISWMPTNRFAHGEHADIQIGDARIRAETVDIFPGQWILTKFTLTADPSQRPVYIVKGNRLVVKPGHNAVFYESNLYLFGQRVIGFKHRYLNLDPRVSGVRSPTPEYRPGKGFGYNWADSTVLDAKSTLILHDSSAPQELPGYGFLVNRSFAPLPKDSFPLSPRSEFQLRFDFGYFDNVLVGLPSSEVAYLQRYRNSVDTETTFNAGVTGRGNANAYSVPGSVQYEFGQKLGAGGFLSDLKLEDIDAYRGPYFLRGEWLNSLELAPKKLGDHLFEMTRIDSGVFQSERNYLWVKGSGSLVYAPNKRLTLGGSIFGALDSGTPDLDIDPLYYRDGVAGRVDYKLGPRKFSLMLRYDTRLGFFDTEYLVTQALGGLEAFVSYREYPGDFHVGVTFRVDQFEDLLTRRNWKKTPKGTYLGLP
jgi:hypothetical protein